MTTQTDDKTTIEELRKIVADILDIEEQAVTDDARFVEDLGVDSLMALEIMVGLEKKYHIKLAEKELVQITCLRNVWELVNTKRGTRV
jgi:acyl carrier protein